MKNYILVVTLAIFLLASCKKEQLAKSLSNVPVSPARLTAVADSLKGSWGYFRGSAYFQNVSFIPSNSDFPLNASIVFNGSPVLKAVDYDGNQSVISYTLTGVDNIFYLNIQKSATDNRKLKIIKLTADSLVVQNTITGVDTSSKVVFTERLFRLKPQLAFDNEFILTCGNSQNGTDTLSIFITPKGGTERLATTTTISNSSLYAFSYWPAIGDHIRTQINSSNYNSPVTIQSYYKGLPYGDSWKYPQTAMNFNLEWDIKY